MDLRRVVTKGWPVAIEVARTMPADPDVVWELVTDWERQSDWMLEARDFVVVSERREGVGVEAEATVRIGGITTRDRVRVTRWEPRRLLAIEHLGWVSGAAEIHLTPVRGGGTHVYWREELRPPLGVAGALGLTAFRPLMARVFRRDLRVLDDLARARAASSRVDG
ncbi:MAG TPA: SRPBCC family protein [Actinomycetota bacterium]|nr:SRPBCC family protein [Actinomycetota bacterium]